MRLTVMALSVALGSLAPLPPAQAQVSIGISIPGVSIGIHQPVYPELVLVPGYPVYYAPHAYTNYFFYDGLYWVYHDDRWYSSVWYDGPWDLIDPYYVPLFVLRVPVRYYVHPPVYFRGWVMMEPPRWDLHWGPHWAHYRSGWNRWDRRVAWAPAPPPRYQRNFHGAQYPRPEQQRALRDRHYRYEPRDVDVRPHYHRRPAPGIQAPRYQGLQGRPEAPQAQRPQPEREAAPQRSAREHGPARQQGPVAYGYSEPPRQENAGRTPAPAAQPVPRRERAAPMPQNLQDSREAAQRPPQAAAMSRHRSAEEPQPRPQQAYRSPQGREAPPQGRGHDPSGGRPERRQQTVPGRDR